MSGKYEVCLRCDGEGKMVNPALSVWTGSDIDDDPEGFDNMINGMYDVVCPECKGKLALAIVKEEDNEIIEGTLTCESCGEVYPIQSSIPNMPPPALRE